MSYIKDRIFVFDIETVIDIESSRSFLGLNSEACKSEIAEKIKKYHVESSFSGSDFVKCIATTRITERRQLELPIFR